jgi:hypothetical protein
MQPLFRTRTTKPQMNLITLHLTPLLWPTGQETMFPFPVHNIQLTVNYIQETHKGNNKMK